MTAFIIDVGDRVHLHHHVILDLGGGFKVRGPDTGRVVDISIGMDLVAIEWDRAQLRGWYDIEDLSKSVTVSKQHRRSDPQQAGLLSEAEMLRFVSIQELLARLGFVEDQDGSCLRNAQTAQKVEFAQIAGRSVVEFVRQGLQAGWLRDYLRE